MLAANPALGFWSHNLFLTKYLIVFFLFGFLRGHSNNTNKEDDIVNTGENREYVRSYYFKLTANITKV